VQLSAEAGTHLSPPRGGGNRTTRLARDDASTVHLAISRLHAAYAEAASTKDWDAMSDLLVDEAEFTYYLGVQEVHHGGPRRRERGPRAPGLPRPECTGQQAQIRMFQVPAAVGSALNSMPPT
jgi:hypothetical protein